ncbi:MAG: AgmX/PglI C-terminal domain-containing protein [Myxococcales bacterium]|nr:AgmX/PglI C-terminal domain-containing protein [Myxococcales bacterium]
MSASSSSGDKNAPKVLRIGIVQRGKIIDEQEMKRRETVSVGTSDGATFTVVSDALPAKHDLFEYDGKNYFLRFLPGMEGRIQQTGSQVFGFEDLRKAGKVVRRGDIDAVVMDDNTRGKVIIGKDITVLFQFKTPLAAPVKPVLPADIRGSLLQNIDAQFTAIFVMVALLQISIVTYARSLPYVEPTSIDQIDQSYQKLIMPDRAPEPPQEAVAENDTTGQDEAKKEEPKKETPKKEDTKKSNQDSEASAKARKEAVAKQVAGKGLLKVLGASGKGEGAISDVFSEGTGAMGDLGDAFSGIQGVDIADGSSEGGTRGGGSGEGVGIGDLATSGGGSVESGKKTEVAVKGSASAQAPEVDGELSSAQISSVMKRQLTALRDCYERALKRDRTLKGKIVIRFEIDEQGRTTNIEFEDSMGNKDVLTCIKGRAKYWRFPKPEGGSVFVAYPIVFTPSS